MYRRALACVTLGWLAGCAPRSSPRGELVPSRSVQALGAANLLLLDLDGGPVTLGADDDATLAISSEGGAASYPAFAASVAAPSVLPASVTAALVDRVRALYLPFDLDVVTERPASGDYAAVHVGGTAAALSPPAPSGIAGLAALDCNDGNATSLGFAFSDSLAPQFGGLPSLASAIAHEAGHGYGLQHSATPRDPMYSVAVPQQVLGDLFALSFQSGAYSPFLAGGGSAPEACGHASPIDNHALLVAALGPRAAALSAPPSLAIVFPPERAAMPSSFPVELSAEDDVGVVRVEIYRDLELVRVLDAPPYRVDLTLPLANSTTLTIEAIDADAQRATVARNFAVEANAPAACDTSNPCAIPMRCVEGYCVLDQPSVDAGGVDGGGPEDPEEGCSVASRGRPPFNAGLALLLAWMLRGSWRADRRRRSPTA